MIVVNFLMYFGVMMSELIPVSYDVKGPSKIPSIWRETFFDIVERFKDNDLEKLNKINLVQYIDLDYAKEIYENIENYGEVLVSLPDATWDTSECLYFESCWKVFIDLYTVGEGRSDLILDVFVFEDEGKFVFQINNIYVP